MTQDKPRLGGQGTEDRHPYIGVSSVLSNLGAPLASQKGGDRGSPDAPSEGLNGSALTLRPYQTAALEAIQGHLGRGLTRLLVALPTGTGKTVVFAQIPRAIPLAGRWLVLAHREELGCIYTETFTVESPTLMTSIVAYRFKAFDTGEECTAEATTTAEPK